MSESNWWGAEAAQVSQDIVLTPLYSWLCVTHCSNLALFAWPLFFDQRQGVRPSKTVLYFHVKLLDKDAWGAAGLSKITSLPVVKPAGWISGNDWHFQQLSEISGDPWKQKRAEPYGSPGSSPGHGLLKREPLSIVITYALSCTLGTGRSENVNHECWWGNRCLSPFKYKFIVPMGEQYMNLWATLASRDGPWTRMWAGPSEDGEEYLKAQPVSGLGTPWTAPGQDDCGAVYGAGKLCLCSSGEVCPQLMQTGGGCVWTTWESQQGRVQW